MFEIEGLTLIKAGQYSYHNGRFEITRSVKGGNWVLIDHASALTLPSCGWSTTSRAIAHTLRTAVAKCENQLEREREREQNRAEESRRLDDRAACKCGGSCGCSATHQLSEEEVLALAAWAYESERTDENGRKNGLSGWGAKFDAAMRVAKRVLDEVAVESQREWFKKDKPLPENALCRDIKEEFCIHPDSDVVVSIGDQFLVQLPLMSQKDAREVLRVCWDRGMDMDEV